MRFFSFPFGDLKRWAYFFVQRYSLKGGICFFRFCPVGISAKAAIIFHNCGTSEKGAISLLFSFCVGLKSGRVSYFSVRGDLKNRRVFLSP